MSSVKKIALLVIGIVLFSIGNVEAKNIVNAYTYDEKNEATKCITGKEATCKKTTCYESMEKNSCPAGTIIDYRVNDQDVVRFHVISDNGKTITMQAQENTVSNIAWYKESSDNTKGPLTALEELEKIVSGWTNVNSQTYTLGETVFQTNAYTGCDSDNSCSEMTYKLASRTTKVRLITIQELAMLGCNTNVGSCPIWVYNYLTSSTSFGGTENAYTSSSYWTMSAISETVEESWWIYCNGKEDSSYVNNIYSGARAVVEINKEKKEEENKNSENKTSQVVKIQDTLKTAYLIYCVGSVILVVGLIVLLNALRKKKAIDSK